MEILIRPVETKDAPAINSIRREHGVMENMLAYPSERAARMEGIIRNLDDNSHEFVAVAVHEDGTEEIAGMAGLHVGQSPRLRHSAGIGIMVAGKFQGQGVGRRLMETLLDMADNWLMLARVELEVYTDNQKAIHLYEKMGFEIEGVRRKASVRNGVLADEYLMSRIKGWK